MRVTIVIDRCIKCLHVVRPAHKFPSIVHHVNSHRNINRIITRCMFHAAHPMSTYRPPRIITRFVSSHDHTMDLNLDQVDEQSLCEMNENQDMDNLADENDSKQQDEPVNSTDAKSKIKKIAMLLCYSGKGYYGMQVNNETRTIEGDLLGAMLKAGIINEELANQPWQMKFERASRTDKGVSAVRQIVSLKLRLQDNLVERINQHLPPSIRVVGWKTTTQGFDAKDNYPTRTYGYMLPTFAFTPITQMTDESYRISNEVLAQVNSVLSRFEGTHSFHNYTSKMKPDDVRCKRVIISCKCSLPFVRDGIEFAKIEIKGQSFMMHQIRKMVGTTIAIVRGLAPPSILYRIWRPEKLDIPKAPGLGLMLENIQYEKYNRVYGGDGVHEPLEWEEYNDQIYAFKEEHIIPTIVEGEKKDKSMLNWLAKLTFNTFDVMVINPTGIRSKRSPFIYALRRIEKEDEKKQQEESLKIGCLMDEETDDDDVKEKTTEDQEGTVRSC